MRIEAVEIDGYKNLTSLVLDGLGRYNVIAGPNNSGKSAIAEALSTCTGWAGLINRDGTPRPIRVDIHFDTSDEPDAPKANSSFIARWKSKPNDLASLVDAGITAAEPGDDVLGWCREMRQSLVVDKGFRYYRTPEKLGFENQAAQTDILSSTADNLSGVLFTYRNNDFQTFLGIEESFGRLFPEIGGIETPLGGNATSVHLRIDGLLRKLITFGDGFSRALVFITALHTAPRQAFVCVEEPETGLHPSLQRRLKRELDSIAASRQQQLLVLTHSPSWLRTSDGTTFRTDGAGGVVNVTTTVAARDSLGALPGDAGYWDLVLICEGESEEAALPILLAMAGVNLEESGVYLNNVRGQGRVTDEVAITRKLGSAVHVSLDGADLSKPPSEFAKDLDISESELTLWGLDGDPGEFEDVFPIDVQTEALRRQAGTMADEVIDKVDWEAVPRRKATSRFGRPFIEVTSASWSKIEFNRLAAEVCAERGEIPQQVQVLADVIQSRLEEINSA